MARNLKLSYALIAALALMIGGSSAAQADTTTWITPGGSKGKLAGEQVGESFKFSYAGRSVTCKTMMWEESFIGATGTKLLPFQPAFTGCITNPGGFNVTITMHECDFVVKGAPTGEGGYLGTTELSCPTGQKVEIEVFTAAHLPENRICNYTVPPQAALGKVRFENRALASEYDDIWLNAEGVKFETIVDGSALICGANGSEGQIFGPTTIRAFSEEGSQTKLTVGHET